MKIILSFSLVLQHCIHFYHNQIIKRYNRIFWYCSQKKRWVIGIPI